MIKICMFALHVPVSVIETTSVDASTTEKVTLGDKKDKTAVTKCSNSICHFSYNNIIIKDGNIM